MAGRKTNAGVLQGASTRPFLRKESGLYLAGNLQFLRSAALGFQSLLRATAFGFHLSSRFIKLNYREAVPVRVLQCCKHTSEECSHRRIKEADATLFPFLILGSYVFGEKNDPSAFANEGIVLGVGLGGHQCESRRAIGRSNHNKASPLRYAVIQDQIKTKAVHKKTQASVLVAHKESRVLEKKVRFASIEANEWVEIP